jgi:Fic family protein
MDDASFTTDAPGTLVAIPEGCSAFIPAPLPRSLNLPPRTQRRLSEADDAIGRLAGVFERVASPYLIATPLQRREAILSSMIEGTYTTPQDMILLEAEDKPAIPLESRTEDTQEVLNYLRAMKHGITRMKELPVSLRLIREIHSELLRGVRGDRERPGEFRTGQNFIGRPADSDKIDKARFVPPPVEQMQLALQDFEKYLHEETDESPPILVRMALAHYQFEAIHPFRDGNGRIGRLLVPLLLCWHKRMAQPLVYVSAYFEQNRSRYIDLLLQVSQQGAWIPWVDFFLEAIVACANECRERAEGLLDLRSRYLEQYRSARSTALLQKLIDDLFVKPYTTIKDAAKLLDVTEASASANIKKLVAGGILSEVTHRQRSQFFIANEILNFSEEHAKAKTGPGPA